MSNGDLKALKERLAKKAQGNGEAPPDGTLSSDLLRWWSTDTERGNRATLIVECLRLRGILTGLYESSISAEDAGDFTRCVQEDLQAELQSWGENPMTAQEYMDAQEGAQARARDEREFERLRQRLGK